MQVQDARRVREAVDRFAVAVAALDLGSMLPASHRELGATTQAVIRRLHDSTGLAKANRRAANAPR